MNRETLIQYWLINSEGSDVHNRASSSRPVIERWLEEHAWVEDPEAPCVHCVKRNEYLNMSKVGRGFSCAENVASGASCTRETYRKAIIPCLREILSGVPPTEEELETVVHQHGQYDGINCGGRLGIMLGHELMNLFARIAGPLTLSEERNEFLRIVLKQVEVEMNPTGQS